ncbi:MAG: PAS domain S-box-containing protein [Candidatus Latescibacterota bacterium]|jgi:PAS domain S-box-containing protein
MPDIWLQIKTHRWIPFAAGTGVLVLSIFLWQALNAQEEQNIRYTTQQTAQTIHDQLAINLSAQIKALKRMGNRWDSQPPTQQIWQSDAEAYVRDMNHFQAISWVDTHFIVRWIIPLKGNEAAVNFNLSTEDRRRQALETARTNRQISITKPIDLVQGGKGFLVYVPLFPNNQFGGFISGVYRVDEIINNMLSEKLRENYVITLVEGDQPFYGLHNLTTPNIWATVHPFNLYDLSWQLHVYPRSLEQFDTHLPEISLTVSCIFSLLLTLLLFTIQKTKAAETQRDRYFSLSLDMLSVANFEGHFLQVNPAFEKTLGYSTEELLKTPFLDLIHPEEQEQTFAEMEKLSQGSKTISFLNRYRCKDGSYCWIEWNATPDLQENVIYAAARDITDRRNSELALHTSEERFRTLTGLAPVGIYETDTEGNCLFVNERWCELTGLTPEEAAGPGWTRALHSDNQSIVFSAWQKAVSKKTEFVEEYRFQQPSGRVVWISGRAIAIIDENNQPRGYIGTVADITQLKEAEHNIAKQQKELQRSNQELGQFAYIASHDLQEPLRVITNYLQLFERQFDKDLPEGAKGYIHRVINGATRMKTLINDLLSYSRITTQAKPFERVDVAQVIENVKDDLEMAISESNVKISHDPLPTVLGDETQIKQVFQNLINNAIKFRGETIPEIHISVLETKTHHQFAISDNGIGIDPKFYERIFAIFQRLHTREEYQGTGIGLAICKKIIEHHDGNIWVESAPGQGATFSFTISKNATQNV